MSCVIIYNVIHTTHIIITDETQEHAGLYPGEDKESKKVWFRG